MIVLYILICVVLLILLPIVFSLLRAYILVNQRPINYLYDKRIKDGNYCYFDRLPYKTIDFSLALEDARFFYHPGYDIIAIKKALRRNLKEKRVVFGGSTITQQLAKNLYFRFEPNLFRKISELMISIYIEKKLSKIEILELYLNVIYYGNDQYGLYDASKYYFNKDYTELTVNQTFFLICLLSAPTTANPLTNPEMFVRIRNKKLCQVLWTGDDKKYISLIKGYDINNLDPELQLNNRTPSKQIKMINEKYGAKIYK